MRWRGRSTPSAAGPNEATALELVIKAREAAYVPIDALHAEQFLHGPMVAFNEGDLLIAVNVPGNAYERVAAICAVAARDGRQALGRRRAVPPRPRPPSSPCRSCRR